MLRALKLAQKGQGYVSPNPMVGALIVKNGKIIGEGYHEKFGLQHAEINALNNLANHSLKGASLFVTLEPCCHYGKMPPCTDVIINSGIKNVVVGMRDPNPLVKGKGLTILKKNGIKVEIENLSGEIEIFYEAFRKYIITKIPFITLKMAMTLDGKIASVTGDSKWISNEKSRKLVHKLRQRNDAILVGVETVIKDDPRLTPYLLKSSTPPPLRIILDPHLRIPIKSSIIQDGNPALIVTGENISYRKKTRINSSEIKFLSIPMNKNKFDLSFLVSALGKEGITSILVEGGSYTSTEFIEQKLVDKIVFFISLKILGGKNAPTPIGGKGIQKISNAINIKNQSVIKIDSDIAIIGYPEYSNSATELNFI
ncbi:MAG: bifunctional diaminohydroxyphosphoribosylaminopyrimidine deaminase/5-amino-6-(5-phosphoribosylamino)uracil reductase RibD [Candidatus Firestonebacteria bacterium]|nr:bifunctional diaminohydroxyphosphoribosylaminopyrimidine deaminase/5-amino-6-(5-phosphoribosylamino)uracil reductase RibD [Candidatus Firestonebacteria bacterium]